MFRVLFLLLIALGWSVFAQTNQNEICPQNSQICDLVPSAEKIDEFINVNDEEFKSRFIKFHTELQKSPNSQGYVINYGADLEVSRREKLIQKSINFKSYDAVRFTIVRGGQTQNPKTEFWIVPPGADNPEPDYHNLKRTERTQTRIFIPLRLEKFGEVSDRLFKNIFNEFFEKIKTAKTSNGYIVMRGSESEIETFENRIRSLEFFEFYKSDRIIFLRKIENPAQTTISL